MSEDVTVEETTQVDTVEATEDPQVEEEEAKEETQAEPVEPTPEEKLAALEEDNKGKQAKIDRQTAAYRKMQEAYNRQMKELDEVKAKIAETQPSKEPSIDDFETHEEYVNALVDYRADAKAREAQEQVLQMQQQAQQAQINKERDGLLQRQTAEYITENPMYKAAETEVQSYLTSIGPQANLHTRAAIMDALYDEGAPPIPKVIDYFGSNNGEKISELDRIVNLPPHKAAVEIYKIQQALKVTPETKEKKVLSKPVKVQKGDKSKGSKSIVNMSGRELLDKFAK